MKIRTSVKPRCDWSVGEAEGRQTGRIFTSRPAG